MTRTPMKRARGPLDKRARARRKAGGKLAAGRDSGTRASLAVEREYVQERDAFRCELGEIGGPSHVGSDFAHVIARSQGGENTRFNALWLCRGHHRMMEAPYAKGRLLVHRITVNGVRGFDWEIVRAVDKAAFVRGDFDTLAAGYIRAERP